MDNLPEDIFPKGGEEGISDAMEYMDRFQSTYQNFERLFLREAGVVQLEYHEFPEADKDEEGNRLPYVHKKELDIAANGLMFEKLVHHDYLTLDRPIRTDKTLIIAEKNSYEQNVYTLMHNTFVAEKPEEDTRYGTFESSMLHIHPGGFIDYRQAQASAESEKCYVGSPPPRLSPILKVNHDTLQVFYDPAYLGDYLKPSKRLADAEWRIDEVAAKDLYITWQIDLEYIDGLLNEYNPMHLKFPLSYT